MIQPGNVGDRLVRPLRVARVPCLLLALAVTAWFGVHAAAVGIEHDNQSLNSQDPEDLRLYGDFKATFGSDEDLLVAVTHPRLLEGEGLALVADVAAKIAATDGVRRAWSLVNAEELVPGELGAEPRPLVSPPWDAPDIAGRAAAAIERNPDFTGWLVSADRSTAGIVVEIEDRPDDLDYRNRLVDSLRALGPEVAARSGVLRLTGLPVQKTDVAASVDADQRVLLPAAVLVLGFTLAFFFRHLSGVVVPLAVAGITVVWTVGLYAFTGHAMNAITSLLPPVMLVVALATSVHVYDAWAADHDEVDRADRGASPAVDARFERVLRAVRMVFVPALFCALTTAQGFASLCFGDLAAVRQFGLFAAFGALVAFVVAMTVVPAALTFVRPPVHRPSDEHGWTLRLLDFTSSLATRRPLAVLVVFAALTVVLTAGIPLVRSNTDLVGFLRQDAPLRMDTEWIDEHLTGTLPLDFVVKRVDGRPMATLDALRRLEALEGAILVKENVTAVASVLPLLRQVHRAESGSGGLSLPDDEEALLEEVDLLDESGHALVRRFAAPEMASLRLTVRSRSVGSAVSLPLVRAIEDDAGRLLGSEFVFTPTGSLWHVVRDSESLVRQQVTSFASAIVLVVAAIGLLFRSMSMTVVAMVPNVLPILWTGGWMGYLGVELSAGTAMIASAVLGLVVDDTIHYLSHYRRVYAGDAVAAIRLTSRAVGAPVTVASTSLVLGFWVGALGSFLPTIYFSLLTGLTMITGVVCDLLVVPALLVLLDPPRGQVDRRPPPHPVRT